MHNNFIIYKLYIIYSYRDFNSARIYRIFRMNHFCSIYRMNHFIMGEGISCLATNAGHSRAF